MNYINYTKHKLYEPQSYHRRYDLDLNPKSEDNKASLEDQAKRIAALSLPFLSLYKPLGSVISTSMGSIRILTHLRSAIASKDLKNRVTELLLGALAVFSVASSIFHFTLGLAISNSIDSVQSLVRLIKALHEKKYEEAAEEFFQLTASLFYLAFMVQGSLEFLLIFSLVQTLLSFYQAHLESEKGESRLLEAFAKIALGIVRFYQAGQYVKLIEKRNELFALERLSDLIRRSLKGREVRHLIENPLNQFKEKGPTLLTDSNGQSYDFGAYFHGYGKALVKGANLNVKHLTLDKEAITEIDFKINHVFRERLEILSNQLAKMDRKEIEDVLNVTQSHAKSILIEENVPFALGNQPKGSCQKITFEGLGAIYIGSAKQMPTLYDRVVVQMDRGKTIYDFHELLTFLEIDDALLQSTDEEIERLKVGHLWRTFFPKEATLFERTEPFFTLPLDELKLKIVTLCPQMASHFATFLPKMRPEQVIGGKVRYRIEGLSLAAENAGARALTATITGAYTDLQLFERVASIIKMGMLSTEMRGSANMGAKGISPNADFYSGGADSVFTQLITKKECEKATPFSQFYYHGKARFIISTDVLETGTYQYYTDSFGNRKIGASIWNGSYLNRPGTIEFIENMAKSSPLPTDPFYGGNEVMIKDRIDPKFFKAIILNDQKTKDNLMNYLRAHDLVQSDIHGHETILNRDADTFLRVGAHITEEILK